MKKQNRLSVIEKLIKAVGNHHGKDIFNDTVRYQKEYGFEMGTGEHATWNNEADAFKHAYMQAYYGLLYGTHIAKWGGDVHEKDGNQNYGQPKSEEKMDQWNNAQGREITHEILKEYGIAARNANSEKIKDIIAKKVIERMEDGRLILDPSGRRKLRKPLRKPKQNNNPNSNKKSQCTGLYPVSGYTREDGTKVEGYTRTCSKHKEGAEKYKGLKFQDLMPEEIEDAIFFFI